MEGFISNIFIQNEVDFLKLKKEHFNIRQTYILKSKSLETATDILVKAAGGNKNFSILGTAVPAELGLFYSPEDLGNGYKLYAFVLKNGLLLDSRGIYKQFSKKIIGQIENSHWAIYK